jgi:capsular polysaccharide transport system permease protein
MYQLIGNSSLLNRSPWQVMWSVWTALFLREALARLFSRRGAWAWLLLEPAFHFFYLIFIYTVMNVRHISGFDTTMWIVVGVVAFFIFDRTSSQTANATSANKSLFSYRQVLPADAFAVRAVVELVLILLTALLVLLFLSLFGHQVLPDNLPLVVQAILGLWLLAIGWGMVRAVLSNLVPELDIVLNLIMRPMYLISGLMLPLSSLPPSYRNWLLLNPVAQGLEAARAGYSAAYHPFTGLSVSYLHISAAIMLFSGLLLLRKFGSRLVTQ